MRLKEADGKELQKPQPPPLPWPRAPLCQVHRAQGRDSTESGITQHFWSQLVGLCIQCWKPFIIHSFIQQAAFAYLISACGFDDRKGSSSFPMAWSSNTNERIWAHQCFRRFPLEYKSHEPEVYVCFSPPCLTHSCQSMNTCWMDEWREQIHISMALSTCPEEWTARKNWKSQLFS